VLPPPKVYINKKPEFEEEIPSSLNLTIGAQYDLKLPNVFDPNYGDFATIENVILGSTSPFSTYENGVILIKPTKACGPFEIKIILTDQKKLTNTYIISVVVFSESSSEDSIDENNGNRTQ
jgi:hypothetical protein